MWLGFIGSAVVVAAFFAQGYYFGYKAAKSEDAHHDLSIENGYLKLLGARMGQIRAAHKGIARLRKKIKRLQSTEPVLSYQPLEPGFPLIKTPCEPRCAFYYAGSCMCAHSEQQSVSTVRANDG